MAYFISSEWTSCNVITGIAIGRQINIQNLGRAGDLIEIIVSDTKPLTTDRGYAVRSIDPTYRVAKQVYDVWIRYIRYDLNGTITPSPSSACLVNITDSEQIAPSSAINNDLIGGNKALTVQTFTELNSKNGRQYEVSFTTTLAAGVSAFIVLEIGNSYDVLIKDVQSQFNSRSLTTTLFKSPTYTGGAELAVYNLNDRDAVPDDIVVKAGVVATDNGIQISPSFQTIGSVGAGNREISSVSLTPDVERVLAKGGIYMYRITNSGSETANVSGYATWYQGPISTQA